MGQAINRFNEGKIVIPDSLGDNDRFFLMNFQQSLKIIDTQKVIPLINGIEKAIKIIDEFDINTNRNMEEINQTTKQEPTSVINKKQRNMQQKREMEYFKDHQTTKQEPISVINKKQRNMQQKREMEYFKDHQTTNKNQLV